MDYNELVKSLRICAKSPDCVGCIKNADGTEFGCKPLGHSELVLEAADAIEELQKHYCRHAIHNKHDRGDDSLCDVIMTEPPKEKTE